MVYKTIENLIFIEWYFFTERLYTLFDLNFTIKRCPSFLLYFFMTRFFKFLWIFVKLCLSCFGPCQTKFYFTLFIKIKFACLLGKRSEYFILFFEVKAMSFKFQVIFRKKCQKSIFFNYLFSMLKANMKFLDILASRVWVWVLYPNPNPKPKIFWV